MAATFTEAFSEVAGERLDLAVGYTVRPPRAAPTDPAVTAAFADLDGSELTRLALRLAGARRGQVTEADDAIQDALLELWMTRPDLFREPPGGWMGLLHEVARRKFGSTRTAVAPVSVEAALETGGGLLVDARPCTAETHGAEEDCRFTPRPIGGEAWTREQILGALQRFRDRHGRPPLTADLRAINGLPSSAALYRHFASMTDALLCAGLTPETPMRRHKSWTPLLAARACRGFRRRNQCWPGSGDLRRHTGELPGTSVMLRFFGGTRQIDVQLGAEAILEAAGEPTV